MKPHYKHLTQEQRYTISAELKSGKKLSCIANDLGVHRTTLWRELKHYTGQRGYRPAQAHKMAGARRPKGKCSVRDFGKAFIACKLKHHWSPEQISSALLTMGWKGVPSHEWIYNFVYSKQGQTDSLRSHLRCQKTYRKRGYKIRERRGQLSKGTSIHERPIVIETRERIGDIEGDTIIGKHHKGAALTLVDRKSLYVWIKPMVHRYAQTTADACISAISAFLNPTASRLTMAKSLPSLSSLPK
jgi:transposase, IS30 family